MLRRLHNLFPIHLSHTSITFIAKRSLVHNQFTQRAMQVPSKPHLQHRVLSQVILHYKGYSSKTESHTCNMSVFIVSTKINVLYTQRLHFFGGIILFPLDSLYSVCRYKIIIFYGERYIFRMTHSLS